MAAWCGFTEPQHVFWEIGLGNRFLNQICTRNAISVVVSGFEFKV